MKAGRSPLTRSEKVNRLAVVSAKALDEFRFFRSWLESPKKMGAVSPSGSDLAREMAGYVQPELGETVLELGPGTGVVTQAILARGVNPADLKLLEYSEDFCALLRTRFQDVTVCRGDAYDLDAALNALEIAPKSLQAIVSSLPLLTRPETDRRILLETAFAALKPGAPFIQFSYGVTPPIRHVADDVQLTTSGWIWRNLPPARVHVYRRRLS